MHTAACQIATKYIRVFFHVCTLQARAGIVTDYYYVSAPHSLQSAGADTAQTATHTAQLHLPYLMVVIKSVCMCVRVYVCVCVCVCHVPRR